jgi:hypothetical protein
MIIRSLLGTAGIQSLAMRRDVFFAALLDQVSTALREDCNLPNLAQRYWPVLNDSEHRPKHSFRNPQQLRVVLDRSVAVFDRFTQSN